MVIWQRVDFDAASIFFGALYSIFEGDVQDQATAV
jgi:hypothetical protein